MIRTATPADAQALSALACELFPLGCPADTNPDDIAHYRATALTPAAFAAHLADPAITILLACDEATSLPIAYTLIARSANPPEAVSAATHELRKFYLHPAHHGTGLAQSLMTAALALASSPGDAFWLSVFSQNPRAIAFYQRSGFRIVGSQHFLVGTDLQQDYLMQRANKPADTLAC